MIILSNLFNNAIEACEKCRTKKIIEMKIDYSNEVLFMAVSNTYDSKRGEIDAIPQARETDVMHGHGLENIQRIVDLHGGQMDVIRDERFSVRIVVPCGEIK